MNKEITISSLDMLLGDPSNMMLNSTGTKEVSVRMATEGQIGYYLDLCGKKNIQPEESAFTFSGMDAEIKRLKDIKNYKPISEKQIEGIEKLCKLMNMPTPDYSKLDGNYGGTGSQFYQKLQKMSKSIALPVTDAMKDFMSNMQFCPDCDKIEDIDSISKNDAHEYINKFKGKFYAWKKDRLTDSQMLNIIRTNCLIEGSEIKDVTDDMALSVNQKIDKLIKRQSLEFSTLIQFNKTAATSFIELLTVELNNAIWKETTFEPEEGHGFETNIDTAEELRNIVAKLYASIGQELEEEFFETISWDSLKELVEFVKLFGVNVEKIFDKVEAFNAKQIEALLA